jgi:predicted transcriptional regulator
LREVSREPVPFSLLEKRALIKTGTYATVTYLIYFLRDSGFIIKVDCEHRAPYKISTKGKLLLEALS